MKLSNLDREDEGNVQPSGRLKVIVVVGYRDTGKTTMIQRLFKRLCFRSVGHGAVTKVNGEDVVSSYWGDCHCGNGKVSMGFFGENGDDEDCVYANLYEVAKANYAKESGCFDFVVIPLRRVDQGGQCRSWIHWVASAVERIRTGRDAQGRPSVTPIPNAFLDAEFHYVHTAWPQYFPDVNPVVGEVASPSVSTIPTVDELSSFVENQVLSLLRMFR